MNDLPEGVRGRILAAALLLTVLAAAWAGIVAPATAWYAERADSLDQQSTLARRMAQIAAGLPDLRRRVDSPAAAAPTGLLEGASDAVAGAGLQQHLQQIATTAGATLNSTEVIPGEQVGAYRRIAVRLSLSATWPVIVQLVDAIVAGTPRLLIDDLQIQSARIGAGPGDPPLNVGMLVFGFRPGQAS